MSRIPMPKSYRRPMMAPDGEPRFVRIDYTNWRGERSERVIEPLHMHFGSSEFHREPQWLLDAMDVERHVIRSFAMKDIHKWEPVK